MSSSDEEGEFLPDSVTDYEFLNQANEHVSLACLPCLLQKDDVIGGGNNRVYLSGSCDDGLQKIYKEVVAWRYELSFVQAEISVLCKGKCWVKLLKPKRIYEAALRSILITVQCLHFVKHNLEAPEESLWSHLSRVFSYNEVSPSEVDCMNHIPLIIHAAEHDQSLKDTQFIKRILSGQLLQRKDHQVESISAERAEFIVDENTDDPCDEDESFEQEDDLFDTCCSICDNGGDILCCEGRCMRSFHASRQTGDSGAETCVGLGLSEAQVKAIPNFICWNCQRQRHQCFVCGKLGSSDITSNAEVFPCIAGNCGRFYHPVCVSKELKQRNDTQIEDLEKRIASGESFVCPAHRCFSCKQVENRTDPEMQFAVCRRCPKSYHRKCLPREIVFDSETVMEILPRAWDGLLPKRALIYCLDHEIDPCLGTPLRNHICMSEPLKVKVRILEKSFTGVNVDQKKRTADGHRKASSESVRLVDKHICGPSFDGQKKASSSNLPKPSTSTIFPRDPVIRHNKTISEKKMLPLKPGNANLNFERRNAPHSAKPLTKKQGHSTPVADIEMERRLTALMEKVDSSFDVDEFLKRKKLTSMYNKNSKNVIDKTLTKGKVEVTVKAVREALQKLDNGGSIDDAKAVCSVEMLRQVPLWKNKLHLYLLPFLHGMHYSSFGRHFTKSEKLLEIVNRLHNYVEDGDMIVDFCCGANEFSCLMKEKLDSVGKTRCSFKNFDLFPSKDGFSFEQRDWFTVNPNELPPGSRLVMGLNPPFGYKATLANKFINKALQFKPKLLILIVPPETQRLDSWNSERRHLRYDLVWEDKNLLAGEAFYFPGAIGADEKHISQWNNTPPPLYLWSHPDCTKKHRNIASRCGHLGPNDRLPNYQPPSSKHLLDDQRGDFMDVYGNLPNVVDNFPGPMDDRDVYPYKVDHNLVPSNIYGHPMSNVSSYHPSHVSRYHDMSNDYGHQNVNNVYRNIQSVENHGRLDFSRHMGANIDDGYLPNVENRGSLGVAGQMGTSLVDPNLSGRENAMYFGGVGALDDMEISPASTPRRHIF